MFEELESASEDLKWLIDRRVPKGVGRLNLHVFMFQIISLNCRDLSRILLEREYEKWNSGFFNVYAHMKCSE